MKNLKIFIVPIILLSMVFLTSCGEKPKKKENKSPNTSENIDRSEDAKNIIGIWKFLERENWFELKADGTYDAGKDGEIVKTNLTWELDIEKGTLTLNDPKKTKVMNYKLLGDELILNREGMKKAMTAVRVTERP
jgi:PBP1b-binding outer membrane lipoprotein LpoB